MGFLPMLLLYLIFSFILPSAFSDGLRVIFLCAFIEVMQARAKNWEEGDLGQGD